jgi:hypothetical protein
MPYNFPSDTVEGMIERNYEQIFRQGGLDPQEWIRHCVEKTKAQTVIPPNYGDLLIELARDDPDLKLRLEKLRRQGVRDEDIRSWYNMHILERTCVLETLEFMRLSAWYALMEKNWDPADAIIAVHKKLARFGDPDDPNWGGEARSRLTEEDRPIPVELYNVVSDFVARHNNDPAFLAKLSCATSMNAVVRQAIKSGELFRAKRAPAATKNPGHADAKTGCTGVLVLVLSLATASCLLLLLF